MVFNKEKILGIAQKFVLKGQSKKAIKEYLKLIEASPKEKRLYLKLGDLYLKNGENEKAIQEFLKLAELYAEEDLNLRAISIYKKVLSINPKLLEALRKIAKLYLKEGLIGSAKNYYQNILEITPNNEEAINALESIESGQQLKKNFKTASLREPTLSEPLSIPVKKPIEDRLIEAAEEESGLFPSAPVSIQPKIFETETPSLEKDSETHYHLGIAYKEMELIDHAIAEFEIASSNINWRFNSYTLIGNCYFEMGSYDKSIEYYRKATEIKGVSNKELASLYFHLGLAFEANGMLDKAKETFKQVLSFESNFPEALEKLKKLEMGWEK